MNRVLAYITLALLVISIGHVFAKQGSTCLTYFYGYGCHHCIPLGPKIDMITDYFPVVVQKHDVWSNETSKSLQSSLLDQYNTRISPSVPMIFSADTILQGQSAFSFGLWDSINRNRGVACPTSLKFIHNIFPKSSLPKMLVSVFAALAAASLSPSLFHNFVSVGNAAALAKKSVVGSCIWFVSGGMVFFVLGSLFIMFFFSNFGSLIFFLKYAHFVYFSLGIWHLKTAIFPKRELRPFSPIWISQRIQKSFAISDKFFKMGFWSFLCEIFAIVPSLLVASSVVAYSLSFSMLGFGLVLVVLFGSSFMLLSTWCYCFDLFSIPYKFVLNTPVLSVTLQGILFLLSAFLWPIS
ncbi:hypothetical protein P9112_012677 [Eukaryota sp. TZLM1-RC]